MAKSKNPLTEIRRIIARFPQTFEKLSHGSPTFWGGKRTFATFHSGAYDEGRPAVWIKAPEGAQEALIATDSERFYRSKYLGPSGWVGVRLVGVIDWAEVRWLLEQGYRLVAPRRALAELDGPLFAASPRRTAAQAVDPVFKKLQLKAHAKILVVGAPKSFERALATVADREVKTSFRTKGPFGLVLVFVRSRPEIAKAAGKAVQRIQDDGRLWFAYPKGDIDRHAGWQPLKDEGFEPVRQVAIDTGWSALRFRRSTVIRRPGRRTTPR